ncbi:hypothetical protein [Brevibacterium sediminis]
MTYNDDLRREMEAHLNNQRATDVGDITEAVVVQGDGEGTNTDPVVEALTQAVQRPEGWYVDDEGGPDTTPTPTTNTPVSTLNWGTDGDQQLTAWLNNRG